MVEIWYGILTFMLIMFVVLEGFDIGAGMLQYAVGKTDAERRVVIAAIGPLWSWHEVWIVGFGGTMLVAFPDFLAISFAGFYLALMLLLWGLIFRGIAIEFSGHINDPLWRTGWHWCFVIANIVLAILIGAALGNVIRGVPLGADAKFSLSFFTNFLPSGDVGILDWYTVSVAVFFLVTFAAHGANGLAHRVEGIVHDRSLKIAGMLWKLVAALLVVVTIETNFVRPDMFSAMLHQPIGWLGLLGVVVGVIAIVSGLKSADGGRALIGSSFFIGGMMVAGAAGIFPLVLRSTLAPEFSLSAYQMAAAGHGLSVALVWWPMAFVLAVIYFLFIYRHYSGKVKPAQDTQIPY